MFLFFHDSPLGPLSKIRGGEGGEFGEQGGGRSCFNLITIFCFFSQANIKL